eukprot:6179448-Pleurochrysis_carterae.AAC.1
MLPRCFKNSASLHIFLASKPLAQLAISQRPSNIAIESDYLAFWPRDQTITLSTLARARQILINCRRARLSFAIDTHMHGLPFSSRIACILAERSRSAFQALRTLLVMTVPAR